MDQLTGQIYVLSKYQQGCRFLQKKLDEKDPTNTKIILGELFDHLPELMTGFFFSKEITFFKNLLIFKRSLWKLSFC